MTRRRSNPPLWLSLGIFIGVSAGILFPHTSDIDLNAIQLGGFLAGAWWGFLEST